MPQTVAALYTHGTLPTNSTRWAAVVVSTNGWPSAASGASSSCAEAEEETHSAIFSRKHPGCTRCEHEQHSEGYIEDFFHSKLKIVNYLFVQSLSFWHALSSQARLLLWWFSNRQHTNKGSITNTIQVLRCPGIVGALLLPLQGRNSDIFHDYYFLPFKSSHYWTPANGRIQLYTCRIRRIFVKKAVKNSPMQSAWDLFVQDTNDTIDFSLKKSVQYHVRKELPSSWNPYLPQLPVGWCGGRQHAWQLTLPEWRKFGSRPLLINTTLVSVWTFSEFIALVADDWTTIHDWSQHSHRFFRPHDTSGKHELPIS